MPSNAAASFPDRAQRNPLIATFAGNDRYAAT